MPVAIDKITIDAVFDEIIARIKETVPKEDLDCIGPRNDMISTVYEAKRQIEKIAESSAGEEASNQIEDIIEGVKEAILDGAAAIKGEGQDEGNLHGSTIEDIANDLVDIAEEEIQSIASPLIG